MLRAPFRPVVPVDERHVFDPAPKLPWPLEELLGLDVRTARERRQLVRLRVGEVNRLGLAREGQISSIGEIARPMPSAIRPSSPLGGSNGAC
jgi:hypothetical protein